MKDKLYSISLPDEANSALADIQPQASRSAFFKRVQPSPFVQLARARAHQKFRITLPLILKRSLPATRKAFFATVRAAEFAAWQATGGDALRSVKPN